MITLKNDGEVKLPDVTDIHTGNTEKDIEYLAQFLTMPDEDKALLLKILRRCIAPQTVKEQGVQLSGKGQPVRIDSENGLEIGVVMSIKSIKEA